MGKQSAGERHAMASGRALDPEEGEAQAGAAPTRPRRWSAALPGGRVGPASHPAPLESLPLASLLLAADGSALAVNEAWTALAGLDPHRSRGDGWLQAVERPDREELRARVRGGGCGSLDCRIAAPDGARRTRWWWRPDARGRLVVCVAAIDDDSAREPAGAGAAPSASGVDTLEVINRIFAVGLAIQSISTMCEKSARARLHATINDLDTIVHDIWLGGAERLPAPRRSPTTP